MNTVSLTLLYSDKIKLTVGSAKLITGIFVFAGICKAKGALIFIVLKTYTFFV